MGAKISTMHTRDQLSLMDEDSAPWSSTFSSSFGMEGVWAKVLLIYRNKLSWPWSKMSLMKSGCMTVKGRWEEIKRQIFLSSGSCNWVRHGVNLSYLVSVYHACGKTNGKDIHPSVAHFFSGGCPWSFWDGLFRGGCSGPGSVGQESTQLASVFSLFSSRTSWSAIGFWMSGLTSELVSQQPCNSVSGLGRERETKRAWARQTRKENHFITTHPGLYSL